MRRLLLTILLVYSFSSLKGQGDSLVIGELSLKKIPVAEVLTAYQVLCKSRNGYQFAGQAIIRFDSMVHAGYLGAYRYANGFHCRGNLDQSMQEQLRMLFVNEKKAAGSTGILFSMEDDRQEFIGLLFLFKKHKFRKFATKAGRETKKNLAGERVLIRKYNYRRYAREFLISGTGDRLSLIPVRI